MHPIKRLLRTVARPVRRGKEHQGLLIHAFRGYGSTRRVYLMGRLFRQPGSRSVAPQGQVLRDLFSFFRRVFRRGVAGELVIMKLGEISHQCRTDKNGFFQFSLDGLEGQTGNGGLIEVSLTLEKHPEVRAGAEIYVTPEQARFAVISDIDDTVMETGVANKFKMFWRLFASGAQSRVAFPGVAEFYQRLHAGRSGQQHNPMLYVSRAPWSIYEMLEAFFRAHDIPVGPVLFLRDWGMTLQQPLPRRGSDHKHRLIEKMLALYQELPFILIGDSGQHDPEVYADIVQRHPGRVKAIYIRDVSRSMSRTAEIEQLGESVRKTDCDLVLTDDTEVMVRHARSKSFIG